MPFNFYYMEKLEKQIKQLAELRYKNVVAIESFSVYEDDGEVGNRVPEKSANAPQMKLGDHWKGKDKYLWVCADITLPEDWKGKPVLGIFNFGETGGGNNSHFESLLFLNDQPYQGIDSNHQEVFFDTDRCGTEFSVNLRLWSGLPGGGKTVAIEHTFCRADLACLDTTTDKLYYLTKNVWETIRLLEETNPNKTWLLNVLVNCFKKVDFSYPGSEEFYTSAAAAYTYLDQQLQGQEKPDITVSLIGHTHIDCAWLWRLKHTREKAARSFSTVNRLMERYDEYIFLQSQAQLYDYIKDDYPEIYEHIKKRVQEGKWEPGGSMWVECDCNLVSGESIVRQILYAKRFFEKEFRVENHYLWLPDVFGYSWALPQILKKSEIDTFVTTKISWNDTNKLPYDTFTWRGVDGSEVTTHFITTPEEFNCRFYTYNGQVKPYTVKGVWDNYSNKDLNTDMLICYGYGDGGGGVNRDMLENAQAIKKIPGLPQIRNEQAKDYFERLNQTLKENPRGGYLPVWDGELYLEFHRGTYTSQANNKKSNRTLEFMLRDAELLSVMSMIHGGKYPAEELFQAWKILLRHQFHDIIPGSSIHEVYEDSAIEYAEAKAALEKVINLALSELIAPEENAYTVANTAPYQRTELVTLPYSGDDSVMVVDQEGNELLSAVSENGIDVLLTEAAPVSFKTLRMKQGTPAKKASPFTAEQNQLETPFYCLEWNSNGQLNRIYDKRSKREVLPKGQCGNVLQIFEDKPREYDAWELESTFEDKMDIIDGLQSVSVDTDSSLKAVVTFVWSYKKSEITQKMTVYAHSPRIDFVTHVNWLEREKLLKTAFPVDIRATDARYDIQYGNIKRPITRNTSWEQAKYETVAHKWATMSETGFGVAILNNCKYGHDIKNQVMRLTLLKSSNHPDYAADLGEHDFTYALLPYCGEWYDSGLEQEAWNLNNPVRVYHGSLKEKEESFIRIDNPYVMLDAVKKAEDSNDILLRIHEYGGSRGKVQIDVAADYSTWCECNLMERDASEVSNGAIEFEIAPYEIKTILIHLC